MRWRDKEPPKEGEERVKVFFAFLPVTIGRENRWLERVAVTQVYENRYGYSQWRNMRFDDLHLDMWKKTLS